MSQTLQARPCKTVRARLKLLVERLKKIFKIHFSSFKKSDLGFPPHPQKKIPFS